MGVLRGAFFIVGGTIGAGFITGAELVRFFGADRFMLPLVCSCALFFVLTYLFLRLGRKYGGYDGVLEIFGRGAVAVKGAFLLCSFISSAGMLAGLDLLCPEWTPLLSMLGLAGSCFFLEKGMDGISKLNLVLVPILLGSVLFYARDLSFFYPRTGSKFPWWLFYAGMNVFFLAPVLMDAGRDMRRPICSSFFAAFIVCIAAVCVLGSVYRAGANALHADMPFLKVADGKVFSVAVGLAIMTSLVSSLYTPYSACNVFSGKKKTAAKGITLLAAFCLSRIGLSGIVEFLYPFIGGAGLFFSVLCILYDQLFEQHDEKVHSRRQNAEDAGRAHHQIELKHLSAVHDEVSEPRP